jgi:hypothetical protein
MCCSIICLWFQVNQNAEALKKNFLELTELKHILRKTQQFFEEQDQVSVLENSFPLLQMILQIKLKYLFLTIIFSYARMGMGKSTSPLPANANILSATFCYFRPFYDVSVSSLSSPIMMLACYQQVGSGK